MFFWAAPQKKKGERTESPSILLVWILWNAVSVVVLWFVRLWHECVALVAWLVGALPVNLILVVFTISRTGRSVPHSSRVCNGCDRQQESHGGSTWFHNQSTHGGSTWFHNQSMRSCLPPSIDRPTHSGYKEEKTTTTTTTKASRHNSTTTEIRTNPILVRTNHCRRFSIVNLCGAHQTNRPLSFDSCPSLATTNEPTNHHSPHCPRRCRRRYTATDTHTRSVSKKQTTKPFPNTHVVVVLVESEQSLHRVGIGTCTPLAFSMYMVF